MADTGCNASEAKDASITNLTNSLDVLDLSGDVSKNVEKKKKERPVLYWGVSFEEIFSKNEKIKELLAEYPSLIPLNVQKKKNDAHITLLFIGKRKANTELTDLEKEQASMKERVEQALVLLNGKEVTVGIDGYGVTIPSSLDDLKGENGFGALALGVDGISLKDGGLVPHYVETTLHITLALSKETPAKNSVETLLPEGDPRKKGKFVYFKKPMSLTGVIKPYFF
jgi:hypothetical protein